MDFIYGYVKNICVFVLVITMILNIFPERQYIKYIKLFAGLLLVILVFNPIIRINKSRLNISNIIEKYYNQQFDFSSDMEKSMEELQKKAEERVNEDLNEQDKFKENISD